jgi:large subunit ribosomal protein L31
MQVGIHPVAVPTQVTCTSCGTSFETRSSAGDITVEICSQCHPAYTGRAARTPGSSRVERFEQRLARSQRA